MANCFNSGTFLPALDLKKLSRDWKTIWKEICAIQQALLDAASQCDEDGGKFCTIVGGSTPMTFVSGIKGIDILDPGAGYQNTEASAVFTDPTLQGTGAAATLTIDALGTILAVTMVANGSQYHVSTTVTINHPLGVSFTGSTVINAGQITGVIVDTGGTSYNTILPVTVVTDNEGTGSGFESVTLVDGTGGIAEIEITEQGHSYSLDVDGEVQAAFGSPVPTTDAVLSVNTVANIWGTDPQAYAMVLLGQSDDPVIKDQMGQVISYFTNLGYWITPKINPNTLNTIEWHICW